jgi:hypothetical protein
MSKRMIELVAEVARKHYSDPRNIKKSTAYRYFKVACQDENIDPCSSSWIPGKYMAIMRGGLTIP